MAVLQMEWRDRPVRRWLARLTMGVIRDIGDTYYIACRAECPVDTGRLRDSHFILVLPEAASIQVTNTAPYASFVHDRNPWMERAARDVGLRARDFIRSGENYSLDTNPLA